MAAAETYTQHVKDLESHLAPFAFSSTKVTRFLSGDDVMRYYTDQWSTEDGRSRLRYRTPLSIERDRILYSREMRLLTDKYHVLFQGTDRILRNYTTQTLRSAHVTRVIASALGLNADFAEGLALGGKVGAVPFVHRAKAAVDEWIRAKIGEIDKAQDRSPSRNQPLQQQLFPADPEVPLPAWVEGISSDSVSERVARYIPWAAGDPTAEAYSSGKQSYWLLATEPYLCRPKDRSFLPETLYGVWRHSRGQIAHPKGFNHRSPLWSGYASYTGIASDHATHEGYVVQYADDVTWIIENLNDANAAAALAGRGERAVYHELSKYLVRNAAPDDLLNRVNAADSGGIYTYFINDLVQVSKDAFAQADPHSPIVTVAGRVPIMLSETADRMLSVCQEFLVTNVFTDLRVSNRNVMLGAITAACLDILYKGERGILDRFLERRHRTHGWVPDDRHHAESLLEEPVHRVQLAVDIFSAMSDEEVYDFTGLEAM